jgi:hypothetical protein
MPRPKAPSINASVSDPSPRACKRCGKTGRITAKPVIIRAMQPIMNARAAMGLALTSSRGMVTLSCSRTAVCICGILSDLGEGSDHLHLLARLSPPSLLFPSLEYNLQFASNFHLSLLPDLAKSGNHQEGRAVWVALEVAGLHARVGLVER